jgi:hypothetical protein
MLESASGRALPGELMARPELFVQAGWGFVGETANGTDDHWIMSPEGYPILAAQLAVHLNAVGIAPDTSRTGSTTIWGRDITRQGYNDNVEAWYIFNAPKDARYQVTVHNVDFDTTVAVFDDRAREVIFNDDFFGGKSSVILKAAAGKRYYIRVAGHDGQTGRFTITLTTGTIPAIQGDLNYDGDVNLVDMAVMAQNWLIGS